MCFRRARPLWPARPGSPRQFLRYQVCGRRSAPGSDLGWDNGPCETVLLHPRTTLPHRDGKKAGSRAECSRVFPNSAPSTSTTLSGTVLQGQLLLQVPAEKSLRTRGPLDSSASRRPSATMPTLVLHLTLACLLPSKYF